jgi:hypothetical protein
VREIPLTDGISALVDDDDYERLSQYEWKAARGQHGNLYARRIEVIVTPGGRKKTQFRKMQRDVLDPEKTVAEWIRCGHRNRDTLDNQRANLQWITPKSRRDA